MSILITIGAFLLKALRFGLVHLLTLPGMLIAAFVGFAAAIAFLGSDVFRCCGYLIDLLTSAKAHVSDLVAYLKTVQNFDVFYSLFALDVFGETFTSFVSLLLVVLVLAGFQIVFQSIVVAVPFLIFKTTAKMLKLATAGKVQG